VIERLRLVAFGVPLAFALVGGGMIAGMNVKRPQHTDAEMALRAIADTDKTKAQIGVVISLQHVEAVCAALRARADAQATLALARIHEASR
jgi:hypothetical protein